MEKPVVGTLLDAYGTFGQFGLSAYYTICFGVLSSSLKIDLPLERSKDTIDSIFQSIDLQHFGFAIVFKEWIADDFKNTKPYEDIAIEYLFKSNVGRIIIHFTFLVNAVDIQFVYDVDQPESEKW